MLLAWHTCFYEQTTDGYTSVCYEVRDMDTSEVIYRTGDKKRAVELCETFNASKRNANAASLRETQLAHSEDAHKRVKGRYLDCVAALRLISSCRKCDDCATCPSLRTCNPMVSHLVATARKALLDCGRKVPKGEEASDANRD